MPGCLRGQYAAMATAHASMTIETSTAATTVEAFLKGTLDTGTVGGDLGTIDPSALVLGASEVPGIEAPGRLQMGGGAWYITDAGSPEQQAAAWDFMKFFNSLESQVTWNIDGGYLPYRTSATKDPRVVADWTNTLSGQWLAIAYDRAGEPDSARALFRRFVGTPEYERFETDATFRGLALRWLARE